MCVCMCSYVTLTFGSSFVCLFFARCCSNAIFFLFSSSLSLLTLLFLFFSPFPLLSSFSLLFSHSLS